jgi:hypothetical protein
MLRLVLIASLSIALYTATALAHPPGKDGEEGHGGHGAPPAVANDAVKNPAAAWSRLQSHRDSLAQSFDAQEWEDAARLSTELPAVAGDLVRVSSALPEKDLAQVKASVRDLTKAGRQLTEAATAKDSARVPELIQRVNFVIGKIGEKYPEGTL